MRNLTLFNDNWTFIMPDCDPVEVNIPHTWNGIDGQDGGNNYLRTTCRYSKKFKKPKLLEGESCLIQFRGVNSECEVFLNGKKIAAHEGGYSTFNVDLTNHLQPENNIEVVVTNEKNNRVYPQRADFTFYGGIYRDVYLITLPENHFAFGRYSSPPLKLDTDVTDGSGILKVSANINGNGQAAVSVYEGDKLVAEGRLNIPIEIKGVHLWDGKNDPFLYTVKTDLMVDGEIADTVTETIGFRTFKIDVDKGFFLNGKPYPLRGVCRHQDRPKIGNAISRAAHEEDLALIMEVGATTVRLAHYQHDQYFYDLCDRHGLILWAEIPYISQHLPTANENAYSQMRELICQNYNHPSIVCWGISNEITIKPISQDTVDCHKRVHEICHEEDPKRPTVVALYMAAMISNKTAHVSDIVSYNLYFGWYLPFTGLTGWKLDNFHKKYPKVPLGLSEYGAEGMPNLHSNKPRRLDNTEEYQCKYHEDIIRIINDRNYLWATHVWNMFDFAADARNQGGEPGMNHKGLVTFDRKTKKDAFYLYKAFWTDEQFIHIASKRFANRTGKSIKIKVYSNCGEISLYCNGKLMETKKCDRIYEFSVPLQDKLEVSAKCGNISDDAVFYKVSKSDPSYKLRNAGVNKSWEK